MMRMRITMMPFKKVFVGVVWIQKRDDVSEDYYIPKHQLHNA